MGLPATGALAAKRCSLVAKLDPWKVLLYTDRRERQQLHHRRAHPGADTAVRSNQCPLLPIGAEAPNVSNAVDAFGPEPVRISDASVGLGASDCCRSAF